MGFSVEDSGFRIYGPDDLLGLSQLLAGEDSIPRVAESGIQHPMTWIKANQMSDLIRLARPAPLAAPVFAGLGLRFEGSVSRVCQSHESN